MISSTSRIDNYAEDGGEELFTKMQCVLRILNDSIGIRLKKSVHLGKEFSPPSLAQLSIWFEGRYVSK